MKKILVLLLSISIILVSCGTNKDEKIIKKLEKSLAKYRGYTTEVDMRTIMDEKENIYKMEESYSLGDNYSLKIIEPIESQGIVIQYESDKIVIEHASIDQSISLTNVKTFNKGLLLGSYLFDLSSLISIDTEQIDGIDYYIFNNKVEQKNKYTEEIRIWLQKKDFKPYILNIIDKDNNPRVIIKYNNFKFIK